MEYKSLAARPAGLCGQRRVSGRDAESLRPHVGDERRSVYLQVFRRADGAQDGLRPLPQYLPRLFDEDGLYRPRRRLQLVLCRAVSAFVSRVHCRYLGAPAALSARPLAGDDGGAALRLRNGLLSQHELLQARRRGDSGRHVPHAPGSAKPYRENAEDAAAARYSAGAVRLRLAL